MKAAFIMNDNGNFLIEVDGKRSNPVSYQSIATLQINGKTYAGVSGYYAGSLPHETVFEVVPLQNVESKTENFSIFFPIKG